MPLPVSLKAVVDAMEMTSDEISQHINRKTGELVMVTEEALHYAEDEDEGDESGLDLPDWQDEMVEDAKRVFASDDFVQLPDRHQIHEWDIMRRFCDTVDDTRTREALHRAIQGRGAFRYFKDTAHDTGVMEDWYRYRDQAMREIAIDFLTAEGIAFDPDKPALDDPADESDPGDP